MEGIYCGNDPDDPQTKYVRITGGRPVKELIETGDEVFKQIHRVKHLIFDDTFQSCRNNSPMYNTFKNLGSKNREVEYDMGQNMKVFKFIGETHDIDDVVKEMEKEEGQILEKLKDTEDKDEKISNTEKKKR